MAKTQYVDEYGNIIEEDDFSTTPDDDPWGDRGYVEPPYAPPPVVGDPTDPAASPPDDGGGYLPPPPPPPTSSPAPAPSGGGMGGGTAAPLGPWTGTFSPPTPTAYPGAPVLTLPTFTKPDPFRSPSVEEALADPGYKVRLHQGEDSLQRWAAARGTLNDSGTADALIEYGQNEASKEYQNTWNRNWNAYNTNYQTQYVDPYKAAYQSAMDTHSPLQSQWETKMAQVQHDNDMQHANAWNDYLQQYQQWRDKVNWGLSYDL